MIDDVEHRDRHDGGDVEPERNIEGAFVAFRQGPEEVNTKHHPDHDHRDVERPDQFGVFLALRQPGGKSDRSSENDRLPAPEVNGG